MKFYKVKSFSGDLHSLDAYDGEYFLMCNKKRKVYIQITPLWHSIHIYRWYFPDPPILLKTSKFVEL